MKYLQGKEYFDFKILDGEIREPGENEILVRVNACGVCGSDVHLLKRSKEYVPLGHEISGVVAAVGKSVTVAGIGDTVIVEDVTLCGVCEDCKNGNMHLCKNMYNLMGQSGMGEYLVVRENSVDRYWDMDPVSASLTEPLAVALNTFFAADLPPAGNIVIYGIGVLGIMCARLARYFGASKIVCVGSNPDSNRNKARCAAALKMGADAVLYENVNDAESDIVNIFGGRKADAVIVTSPPKTLLRAIKKAKYGAKVVVIGLEFSGGAKVEIDLDGLIFNKNAIIPVLAEPAKNFPLSIKLLQSKVVDASLLVTHTFTLDDARYLRELYTNDEPVIKAVLVNGNI